MKIREFQKILREKKIAAAVFFNLEEHPNPNFVYFSQFEGWGTLIIRQSGKSILLTPKMEAERARKTNNKVVLLKKNLFPLLKKYCRGRKIGIDKDAVTLNWYKVMRKEWGKKQFVDISKQAKQLRAVKTKQEIAYLRKACALSDRILQKCFRNFKTFKTELEVANFLEEETRKCGCQLSFPVIVASGRHASMPHYTPKKVKLQKGFCVIDFGVKYNGYCSDTTRTVYLGKPSKHEEELYTIVLQAQEAVTKMMRPGVHCGKLYDKAVERLGRYAKYFTHGLGHGVGVEIHELPNLKPKNKEVLKQNMVVTNEPGIYLPKKLGIRIEDTVLIAKQRARVLTKVSKKLRIIQ